MLIFLYDDLMSELYFSKVTGEEMIRKVPAFTTAYLVDAERTGPYKSQYPERSAYPVMIERSGGQQKYSPVFGACIEVADIRILQRLDAYYACSMYNLGENKFNDTYHRKEIDVSIIEFDSMESFLGFNFEIVGKERVQTWFGNPRNPVTGRKIDTRLSRIGHVWRTFFNVF